MVQSLLKDFTSALIICFLSTLISKMLNSRAERDRASIYTELQQTRGAVEQVGREKVQRSFRPCTVEWSLSILHPTYVFYPPHELFVNVILVFIHRAEKEKAQYFGELNDLRASVDHLANEKV